jgi:hypothetical protein
MLLLADLQEAFTVGHTSYCKHLNNGFEPVTFGAVTHDETPHAWTVGTITDRRTSPSASHPPPSPPEFKWTLHSLRKGAASAAACIGAPLSKIRYIVGWSKTNDVVTGK